MAGRGSEWQGDPTSSILVPGVGDCFLRGDGDDQQDVAPFLLAQVFGQDVVDQVLSLHGVHTAEALRGDDSNDLVVVAQLYLVRGWEVFFQNLPELLSYRHWRT